ncbi:MAG: TlpA disulfide reductase family protein [Capnocytophaga sp.]|nr:TlpA disulfide reductase family protein [Capnocytophaga sp.]
MKIPWKGAVILSIFALLIFTPLGTFINNKIILLLSPSPKQSEKTEQITEYTGYFLDNKDQKITLQSFENEVVIINFWATWCSPCLAEKPSFQKLYEDYKDKIKFAFITQETPIEVKNFLEKHHYTIPIYYEAVNLPELLSVKNIPTTFILDKKGNIIIKQIGATDWNSKKIRELLDKLTKN